MAPTQNRLLSLLPHNVRTRLLREAQSVPLTLKDLLYPGGKPVKYIYFPVQGFISLVALVEARPALEVSMIGSEGMVGSRVALGDNVEPLRAIVQGAGVAWRVTRFDFARELSVSVALARLVQLYISMTLTHLTTAAACARFHEIGPRLARWLLMTQDRAHADTFRVTHEFLAYMLGVRRGGITVAAGALHARGLITYQHGRLTVLNRRGLEAAACSCYGADRRALSQLSR